MKKHLLLFGFALVFPSALHAQNAIGEVYSGDASVRGSVVLSVNSTHVLSGSQISAGDGVAQLRLARGGELRICPKTSLSLSADASGKSLVLGMNAGAMELDYSLATAQDSLLTPDFRLQLISPGTFHLAISVAPTGDTCVRTLPGNDASVFIAEMMGTDSYQLSPGKNVLFRAGRISGATDAPSVCGCPAPKPQTEVLRAAAPTSPEAVASTPLPPSAPEETKPAPDLQLQSAPAQPGQGKAPVSEAESHLEVQSSFAYRGSEAVQDYYASIARLSVSTDNSRLALALLPHVTGPVAKTEPPPRKPSALRRFGRFVGHLFWK